MLSRLLSAIKHSVASSWFSSQRIHKDAQTNTHQILQSRVTVLCNVSSLSDQPTDMFQRNLSISHQFHEVFSKKKNWKRFIT